MTMTNVARPHQTAPRGAPAPQLFAALLLIAALGVPAALGQEVPASQLTGALLRLGLGPRDLAAAGVSSQAAAVLVAHARDYLAQHGPELDSADAAVQAHRGELQRLARLAESGSASSSDIAALDSEEGQLNAAISLDDSVLAALLEASTSALASAQTTTLSVIAQNIGRPIATEFLVVGRTDTGWTSLRDALANERRAADTGEALDSDSQSLLASVRSESAVAAAIFSLGATLPAVDEAWTSAVQQ